MAKAPSTPTDLIDQRIAELADWRGNTLARMRKLIHKAVPDVVEEWKWRGVPVWSRDGIITTGETYKAVVKLTFAKGAALRDPKGLFNASLEGNARRAIDLPEGAKIDEQAFFALVRAAVALNQTKAKPKSKKASAVPAPKLLSGGNPQIAKADGQAPVSAYIAAAPGWKRDLCQRIDEIITAAVPKVQKAVKWNSPMYGMAGQGWFMSLHCFTTYVKIGFFNGADLKPLPPEASKQDAVRYLHIHGPDELDTAQMAKWAKQAAKLPGWGKV